MIFVTVGSDVPFDRLLRVVDKWASDNQRRDVFAQIGEHGWAPAFIEYRRFLEPEEFAATLSKSAVIVAHAGMGTILSALKANIPILVMPRRAHLGETRNDHQFATAERLSKLGKINVAFDETALVHCLDNLPSLRARASVGPFADPKLISSIRQFVFKCPERVGAVTASADVLGG